MEQLARLQARIGNLHDLRELVGALRGLAASHVQEAQANLAGIRRYVDVVEDAIAEGAALLDGADGRPGPPPGDASVLIAVCAPSTASSAASTSAYSTAPRSSARTARAWP